MTPFDWILALCCFATSLRLMFYRRSGSTFKRHISAIAWLAIVGTGSAALLIITGRYSSGQLGPVLAIAALIITARVYIAQGNISQIIRITRGWV